MTYKNLEIVAITHDIPESGLKKGDTGTIVEVYDSGSAYEVEFINSQGETLALLTLDPSDIRSLEYYIWSVTPWNGLKESTIYPSSNSYGAGTAQFSYNQL